jgi:hypothetical protein
VTTIILQGAYVVITLVLVVTALNFQSRGSTDVAHMECRFTEWGEVMGRFIVRCVVMSRFIVRCVVMSRFIVRLCGDE